MGECLDATLCPERAERISSSGGYRCRGRDGFIPIKSLCKDMGPLFFIYLLDEESPPLVTL